MKIDTNEINELMREKKVLRHVMKVVSELHENKLNDKEMLAFGLLITNMAKRVIEDK